MSNNRLIFFLFFILCSKFCVGQNSIGKVRISAANNHQRLVVLDYSLLSQTESYAKRFKKALALNNPDKLEEVEVALKNNINDYSYMLHPDWELERTFLMRRIEYEIAFRGYLKTGKTDSINVVFDRCKTMILNEIVLWQEDSLQVYRSYFEAYYDYFLYNKNKNSSFERELAMEEVIMRMAESFFALGYIYCKNPVIKTEMQTLFYKSTTTKHVEAFSSLLQARSKVGNIHAINAILNYGTAIIEDIYERIRKSNPEKVKEEAKKLGCKCSYLNEIENSVLFVRKVLGNDYAERMKLCWEIWNNAENFGYEIYFSNEQQKYQQLDLSEYKNILPLVDAPKTKGGKRIAISMRYVLKRFWFEQKWFFITPYFCSYYDITIKPITFSSSEMHKISDFQQEFTAIYTADFLKDEARIWKYKIVSFHLSCMVKDSSQEWITPFFSHFFRGHEMAQQICVNEREHDNPGVKEGHKIVGKFLDDLGNNDSYNFRRIDSLNRTGFSLCKDYEETFDRGNYKRNSYLVLNTLKTGLLSMIDRSCSEGKFFALTVNPKITNVELLRVKNKFLKFSENLYKESDESSVDSVKAILNRLSRLMGDALFDSLVCCYYSKGKERKLFIYPDVFTSWIPFDALPLPHGNRCWGDSLEIIYSQHLGFSPSGISHTTENPVYMGVSASDCRFENLIDSARMVLYKNDTVNQWISQTIKDANVNQIEVGLKHQEKFIGKKGSNRILLIAAHGEFVNDSSFIKLKNKEMDIWNSKDIKDTHISAELVFLLSCRTNLGRELMAEGEDGVTSAFMVAGAKRVIAPIWSVNIDYSAKFIKAYFKKLNIQLQKNERLNYSLALAETKKEFRELYPDQLDWMAYRLWAR